MKKRILALILSLTMIFTMSAVNLSAMAQTTNPTITLESIEAENGEEVAIKVLIENNPGIWGMDLKISYDKTALTLTSVDNGDFYQASEWTQGNLSADIYILSYEASGFDNITTQSGTLATLNFKVSEIVSIGDYAITATYNAGDIINVNFDDVDFEITDGKVTVKAKPVAATGVTLNKDTLDLTEGENETLIATVSPDSATNKAVSWKSSDTTVATVDSNGNVTAIKKGTVTITVTTEDRGYTDSCEVSVACSHANRTTHPAADSTCLVQGNGEYSTCDDCGIVVSGLDEKLPFASHKGGTATCKDKAVCTVCKESYGEYTSHQLTNHSRNEANHNNAGNIEYWTCDVCDKYFNDAAGKNEIDQKDTVIDKVLHSYDTEWSYNGTQHWKECACGEQAELANHQFDNDCDTTCNSGCGYTRSISHQWKSAYSTDNNKHWYECDVCGEKKGEESHSGGTATCKDKAVCVVCDKAYGDLAQHDMKEKVDATYLKLKANCVAKAVYYKSCSVCGAASTDTFETGKIDSATHTGKTEVKDAVKETCTTDGYSGDTYCKDCGVKLEDGKVVPMGHKIIKVNAVPATQEKDGNIEYFACSGCNKLFAEEDATTEITLADTIIKKQEVNVDNKLDDEKTDSPKTFDSSMYIIWTMLLFISISVFVGMKTYNKKEKKF